MVELVVRAEYRVGTDDGETSDDPIGTDAGAFAHDRADHGCSLSHVGRDADDRVLDDGASAEASTGADRCKAPDTGTRLDHRPGAHDDGGNQSRLRVDDRGLVDEGVVATERVTELRAKRALEDVPMGEHVLPAGSLVMVSIGAANHDPEVFEAPGRLDLTRKPNPHLSFGFGTHFCMGAPLARLEAQIAFETLLRRFPHLQLLDENPPYRDNYLLRGVARLPVGIG